MKTLIHKYPRARVPVAAGKRFPARSTLGPLLAAVLLPVMPTISADAAAEQGSLGKKTERNNWAVQANPSLPNVLILGDSISIGYTQPVRELLQSKANVFRPLKGERPENCGNTETAIRSIDRWLAIAPKWDVIHFNSGLHDLKRVSDGLTTTEIPSKVSIEKYKTNLQEIVDKMKATGARLIFAATTAYPNGAKHCLPPDAIAYNAAALEVMKQNGVAVDDLYAFTVDRLAELQKPVDVHFTSDGSRKIAGKVAESILSQLGANPH